MTFKEKSGSENVFDCEFCNFSATTELELENHITRNYKEHINSIKTQIQSKETYGKESNVQSNHEVKQQNRTNKNVPISAKKFLKQWFLENLNNPYPTEDQKMKIAENTGLTVLQVNNWFINAR